MDKIFEEFGRAVFLLQSIEMDVVSMVLLISAIEIDTSTSEQEIRNELLKIESIFDKKTFGRIIRSLQGTSIFSDELEIILNKVLKERNYLIHHYFKDNDVLINENQIEIHNHLEKLVNMFFKCSRLTKKTINDFMLEIGLSKEQLEKMYNKYFYNK